MDCTRVRELIETDYLDNECTPKLSRQVSEHLRSCQSCAQAFAAMEERRAAFRAAVTVTQPDPNVWQHIAQQLPALPRWKIILTDICAAPRLHRTPAFALALLFFVGIGLFAMHRHRTAQIAHVQTYLIETMNEFDTNGDDSFGSTIEESFL